MNIGIFGSSEMGIWLASKFNVLRHPPIYCRDINLEELKKGMAAMGATWSDIREVVLLKHKADEALMKADYPAYLKGLQN